MNVFALASVVETNAVDVENMMRRFERRAPKYLTMEHTSRFGKKRTFDLVPCKDNAPNAEFNVDTMSAVEREEIEEERRAEEEANAKVKAQAEKATKAKAGRALKNATAVAAAGVAGTIKEGNEDNEGEEAQEMPPSEEEKGKEHKATTFAAEDVRQHEEGREGEEGEGEGEGDDLGSVASQQSQTSIMTPMVDVEGKLAAMYTEQKLDPEPGWDLPQSYDISLEDMLQLCRDCNMTDSDTEIVEAMFRLVDSRGFEVADLRSVMVPLAITTCKNGVAECVNLVLSLFDRAETDTIEKTQMLRIFNLINEGVLYMGDRALDSQYIVDLVDSVYTTSGKIDGYINYSEYVPSFLCLSLFAPIMT
jgi:Ca2+-binding EF-hand superfamily protein